MSRSTPLLVLLSGLLALVDVSTGAASDCGGGCRGLGVDKVTVADEHCGFVPLERKEIALEAACRLAAGHPTELVEEATATARRRCPWATTPVESGAEGDGCQCREVTRRWENVYTHVLSQRCWAECGWAVVVECEPEAEEPPGSPPEAEGGTDPTPD